MRRAARVDANQAEIVSALRAVGASVRSLAMVGSDLPDLLVGFRNRTFLLELKDGSKPPSQRKLRPGQQRFFDTWQGQVAKVESVDEALKVING